VVIPKEIRRTMRIREGDPLEIYTTREGEVIFKKYSLIGGLEDFAAQFCDTLSRSSPFTAAVTDRDTIIAVAGNGKRELLGKQLSSQLEVLLDSRDIYRSEVVPTLPATDNSDKYTAAVAAPILCAGDVLGLVLFLTGEEKIGGESEYKLAQTVAAFLGRHMEG
jgi:AbrB family transcriptional regulator (stage V sporulation protein T)